MNSIPVIEISPTTSPTRYLLLQATKGEVTIHYNKLHADPKRGKDLDLILKKLKHQIVENMSSSTADALGLSRAILCNDSLVKKLQELERTEQMYKGLVEHTRGVLRGTFDLLLLCREGVVGRTMATVVITVSPGERALTRNCPRRARNMEP